jgi:hypothetical protein
MNTTIIDLTAYTRVEVCGRRLYLETPGAAEMYNLPTGNRVLSTGKTTTLTFRGGKTLILKGDIAMLINVHLYQLECKGKDVLKILP